MKIKSISSSLALLLLLNANASASSFSPFNYALTINYNGQDYNLGLKQTSQSSEPALFVNPWRNDSVMANSLIESYVSNPAFVKWVNTTGPDYPIVGGYVLSDDNINVGTPGRYYYRGLSFDANRFDLPLQTFSGLWNDPTLTVAWLVPSVLPVWLSGPSADDTLASMQPNAAALRNAFNLQSAKMAQGLSYDCSVFDAKNICVSFAGTRSDGKGGLDDTRGALIVAHKPNANVRFGGYIDQAFNSSESGGLKVKHSSPGYGVFAVWSEKADGSGLQVRGSVSFGKADMESTRSEIGSVEPGFGKSDIKSDGFQIEASRDYAVNAMWSARPYVGFRQLTNRRASYTERTEEGIVDFPLSYSSIKQSTQSLLAGVRFAHTISAQTTMTVAAGLEHDIKNDVDRYEATGVEDLGSIDTEDGKKNTRPTLNLGLTHVIDKAQRIGVSITHRKEAFESGSTTSGMVQYSRGF